MTGKIMKPYVVIEGRKVPVSYETDWSTINNSPPITYDDESNSTVINSSLEVKGDINTSGRVYNAVWNDYAELFLKGETLNPGDVVSYDYKSGKVFKSKIVNDPMVVGVVSDTYGHLLGGDDNRSIEENLMKYVPIGLAGRVSVKVSNNSDIRPGDYLVSDTNGLATKADFTISNIIGKALSYPKDNKVLMLITLGR